MNSRLGEFLGCSMDLFAGLIAYLLHHFILLQTLPVFPIIDFVGDLR